LSFSVVVIVCARDAKTLTQRLSGRPFAASLAAGLSVVTARFFGAPCIFDVDLFAAHIDDADCIIVATGRAPPCFSPRCFFLNHPSVIVGTEYSQNSKAAAIIIGTNRIVDFIIASLLHTRMNNTPLFGDTATTLASIVQPLVDSGFVSVAQVGSLAQVSTDLNKAALEESIWASLCQREYPITAQFPAPVKHTKGFRWLYKKWSTPIVKRRPSPTPLAPPACKAEDISFYVHIKYKDVPVVSATCSAEDLVPLMEGGRVSISLGSSAILGNAEWDFPGCDKLSYEADDCDGFPVWCQDFDVSKLHVLIHVYRATDTSMCCVFDSNDSSPLLVKSAQVHPCLEEGDNEITRKTKFDLSKPRSLGLLSYVKPKGGDIRSWPLRDTKEAAEISLRLPYPIRLAAALQCGVVKDDKFSICSLTLFAMETNGDYGGSGREFRSQEEAKKHGVTLLHILSELQDS